MKTARLTLWIVAMLPSLAGAAEAINLSPGRFAVVSENVATLTELKAIEEQAGAGNAGEAAARLQALLRERGEWLAGVDEDGLVSIATLVELMGAREKGAIGVEYRRQFDGQAKHALDALRQQAVARPEDFYALARRYPLSTAAALAYVDAGDRAVGLGDAWAALSYFAMAWQAGSPANQERTRKILTCQDALARIDAPADQYRGPVVYAATWYGKADAVGSAQYTPYAADGTIYLSSARHVLAAKENGQMLWRWTSPDAWGPFIVIDKPNDRGHGACFTPVPFVSPEGPKILVARQARAGGREFSLRAVRVTDGKLLWSSEAGAESLSIAGNPAIAGRFVYAVAVEFGENATKLVLAAFDLMDGRLIFKCPLGTMLDLNRSRPQGGGWDPVWDQSEPVVADDMVYVTPGVGSAFAVGRFDGVLRWARAYDGLGRGAIARRKRPAAAAAPAGEWPARPAPSDQTELLRWRATPVVCGQVVVIAPQDRESVWGLDARSGRPMWGAHVPAAPTLIGRGATCAILAGASVVALDPNTGQARWTFEAPRGQSIIGPPVLAGGVLYVPTSDFRTHSLSPDTGQAVSPKVKQPNYRQLAATDAGRKALDEAGITKTIRK